MRFTHHSFAHRLLGPVRLSSLALLCLIIVASTQVACGDAAPSPEQVALGKLSFDQVCSTCHGRDARGLPKQGKDLHNNAFTQGLNDQELVEFLKVGRPATHPLNSRGVDMPPRGGDPSMTDEKLFQIVAFLRTLN